ncbi:SDR family oxidoreductase [Streptomyces sp. Y7]|uniref:SDR family oxidoreductase n=1 Tax=Streptomyces sp. Y7 TaxID=3342392 RepID=UPI00371E9E23
MHIEGSVALVTGANRGLGKTFVDELLAAGAAKVYAAGRRPDEIDDRGDDRVVPLPLDLSDPASIASAAARATDVTLLVNNAGINTFTPILGDEAEIRREFETNVFGTLAVSRAFAPVLGGNGGGALVTILSSLSWFVTPDSGGYAAAKAALWSVTNALRLELLEQRTNVVAVHCGAIATDMASATARNLISPQDVAKLTLEGVEADAYEVLTDELSRRVRRLLAEPVEAMYRALQGRSAT